MCGAPRRLGVGLLGPETARPMPIHECPGHFAGGRTRNRRSNGHGIGRAGRWRACGCATASGAVMPIPVPLAVAGSDPPLRDAWIGIGEDRHGTYPCHPPRQVAPRSSVLGRKAARASRDRRIPSLVAWLRPAPSEPPPACAAMPNSPMASRSPSRRSAASKRRWKHPSGTDCWLGSDPKGAGAGVRKHTCPRTRTRPSDWGVAPNTAQTPLAAPGGRGARAQDVRASRLAPPIRCAWRKGRSAHRTPMSIARSSAAMTRARVIGTVPPRGARSARCCRAVSPHGRRGGGPPSRAPRCVSGRLADRRTPRGRGPRP